MIRVSNLTRLYGPRTAIDQISFHVQSGEVVGFLGPNGAGKSTTMKILTGFMPATTGSVEVAGYNVFTHPIEVKKLIGFLPENPPVYLDMQVRDYLKFCAELHFVPRNQIDRYVDQAIQKTFLGDVRNRIIGNLSKGYRQRVGLAQALVHDPKVLILDEPTVGLDPKQIVEIRQLIKSLAGDHTVILSSHILPEVTATCQRIIVISKGRIVAEDSIELLTLRMNKGATYILKAQNIQSSHIQAIQSIAGVAEVQAENGALRITLNKISDSIKTQILETAVSQKMGVTEFSPEKISLEEVFMELTTEESMEGVSST